MIKEKIEEITNRMVSESTDVADMYEFPARWASTRELDIEELREVAMSLPIAIQPSEVTFLLGFIVAYELGESK